MDCFARFAPAEGDKYAKQCGDLTLKLLKRKIKKITPRWSNSKSIRKQISDKKRKYNQYTVYNIYRILYTKMFRQVSLTTLVRPLLFLAILFVAMVLYLSERQNAIDRQVSFCLARLEKFGKIFEKGTLSLKNLYQVQPIQKFSKYVLCMCILNCGKFYTRCFYVSNLLLKIPISNI